MKSWMRGSLRQYLLKAELSRLFELSRIVLIGSRPYLCTRVVRSEYLPGSE